MRIQAYTAYSGTITITASTLRPTARPSVNFTAATIHEDYAAQVRGLLEEHIHIPPTDSFFPAANRLQAYFPASAAGLAIYSLTELRPAGTLREIDQQYMLEITRLRWQFQINLLPAAFAVNGTNRNAIERAMEFAIKSVFQANGVPDTFIPGDNDIRQADGSNLTGTDVDIMCELGVALLRSGVDIPAP